MNISKKVLITVLVFVILSLTVVISVTLNYNKPSENFVNENAQNIEESVDDEVILYKDNSADLAVDFSDIKNLIDNSEIVAIVKINSETGMNYNPVKEEYVPVYTTGTMKVEKVLLNTSNKKIEENQELEYVRLGGKIEYSKYLEGLRETEREKLEQNMYVQTKMTKEQIAKKIVRDMYINDIEVESNKEYLVFLKYTNDYNKYNILGFEYGLREYDSKTMKIKNNETKEFENMEDIVNKVNQFSNIK